MTLAQQPRDDQAPPQAGHDGPSAALASTMVVDRALLLRALAQTGAALAAAGLGLGLLLFGGENLMEPSAQPYYGAGLGAAALAMLLTVWLHGRFASTQMPGATGPAVSARLTGLLAAGMGVKMALLVLGFLALKQFPLGAEPAKFSEIATFAVTFVGAALLCQIGTALTLARALGRRPTTH